MYNKILKIIYVQQHKYFHLSCKMPKSKKNVSEAKAKNSEKTSQSKKDVKGAIYFGNNSEIIMKVHAKPGAKESAITDVREEAIGIQIGAPPVDGEANKELVRFLAEILKLRKSDIALIKGSQSKEKTIAISKDTSLNNVIEKLHAASKQ